MVARGLLDGLDNYYPDFGHWFINTCIPGIVLGDDTMLVARDGSTMVGIALSKKTPQEAKLRCVRVRPEYQSRGVGIHLVEKTLRLLNVGKPHCTVAEEMIHLYSRSFVNHFGFELNHVAKGAYRPGKLEYIFN
jgi:ribosomal protein S18 acetylase RimI-like enzyme